LRVLHGRRVATAAIILTGLPVVLAGVVHPAERPAAQEAAPTPLPGPVVASTEGVSILLDVDLDAMAREQPATPADAAQARLSETAADQVAEQSAAILRRRLQEAGVTGALVERDGPRRIRVTLPHAGDLELHRGLLLRRGRMTLHLVLDSPSVRDADAVLLPGEREGQQRTIRRQAEMDGSRLADAQAIPDRRRGEWAVHLKFDAQGTKRFAEVTREAVGRALAIVVDGRVVVAPVILEPILLGEAVISGSLTARTAGQLAILLRSGALPAPLAIVEEAAATQGSGTRR